MPKLEGKNQKQKFGTPRGALLVTLAKPVIKKIGMNTEVENIAPSSTDQVLSRCNFCLHPCSQLVGRS